MKKYIAPEFSIENLLVDESIAALESISGVEFGSGSNTDTDSFGGMFGN